MFSLVLVRHAKAVSAADSDFARPLSDSGRDEADRAAQRLAAAAIPIDRILCSSAARAVATAARFAARLDEAPEPVLLDDLYLAAPGRMLELIAAYAKDAAHLMVVGHNPGISELAGQLSGRALGDLPTCTVVRLDWMGRDWSRIPTQAPVLYLDHPLAGMLR